MKTLTQCTYYCDEDTDSVLTIVMKTLTQCTYYCDENADSVLTIVMKMLTVYLLL